MGISERAQRKMESGQIYGASVIDSGSVEWSRYELQPDDQARVRSAEYWLDDLIRAFAMPETLQGSMLPWDSVRDKIRVRPGELSLWSGFNGHGKSLALGQVMLGMISQSEKVCIASLEMQPVKTLQRMVRQFTKQGDPGPTSIRGFESFVSGKLWIYDQVGTVKHQRMIALCRYARDEIGCNHIVIDSLMKCGVGSEDYERQAAFVDVLSTYAKDSGLHIHLVAHTKKRDDESLQGKMDVKGASELTNMADNVFIWWMNKKKYFAQQENDYAHDREPDAVMVCEKQRNGEWMGKLGLWFESGSMLYSDQERR